MANLELVQKDGYVMGHELGYEELLLTYAALYRQMKSNRDMTACVINFSYNYAKQYRVPQSASEAVRKGFDHSKTTEGVEYWKKVMDELEES
jgi:hypothetical protein